MSDQKRANSSKPVTSTVSSSAKLRQVSSAKLTFNNNDISTMNLLDKEEEYKRLNAELEKKTANLVYEAEQVLKANEKLINEADYLDKITDVNFLNNETISKQKFSHKETSKSNLVDINELAHLKQTISNFENDNDYDDDDNNDENQTEQLQSNQLIPRSANEMSNEAQIRFLKAKLKVMQEELERFQFELNKKEEENLKLAQRCKELDEDRAKQLRISNSHQTQMDKFKKLNEDLQVKLNAHELQQQALKKENDQLKKDTKKQQTDQQQVDLRLNRALEEIEKYKQQLAKTQTSSKDSNEQEKRRIEQLQSDNKRLQKQKLELIQAFKKQLKLIDILKKQKMHLEAAKMLQFTEDEFMNALEWNSTNVAGPSTATATAAPTTKKQVINRPSSGLTSKSNSTRSNLEPKQNNNVKPLEPKDMKQDFNDEYDEYEDYNNNNIEDDYGDDNENQTPIYNNVLLDEDDDDFNNKNE
jgi:hypothetical protein